MSCPFEERIDRSLIEPPTIEESAAIRRHVEVCPTCRNRFEATTYLETLLVGTFRRLEQEAGPPPTGRILALVGNGSRPARASRRAAESAARRRRFNWRLVLYVNTLAALLLMLVAYIGFQAAVAVRTRPYPGLARASVKALAIGLRQYEARHRTYPPDGIRNLVRSLQHLSATAFFLEEYLNGDVYSDPWGRPYVYRRLGPDGPVLIYSLGANGVDEEGEGDDIAIRLET